MKACEINIMKCDSYWVFDFDILTWLHVRGMNLWIKGNKVLKWGIEYVMCSNILIHLRKL